LFRHLAAVALVQLLADAEEELLGVASDLGAGARADMFFYFAPIFVKKLEAFKKALVFELSPTALLGILVNFAGLRSQG